MEEAAQLCDRVVIIDEGTILLEGTPEELVRREVGKSVIEIWNHRPELLEAMRQIPGRLEEVGDRVYLYPEDEDQAERMLETRFPGQDRLLRRATLEDVFLRRTGRALRD
jgi:lipooligosaccharide transport system ATP-binding protein